MHKRRNMAYAWTNIYSFCLTKTRHFQYIYILYTRSVKPFMNCSYIQKEIKLKQLNLFGIWECWINSTVNTITDVETIQSSVFVHILHLSTNVAREVMTHFLWLILFIWKARLSVLHAQCPSTFHIYLSNDPYSTRLSLHPLRCCSCMCPVDGAFPIQMTQSQAYLLVHFNTIFPQ